jgi:hypothetical protein
MAYNHYFAAGRGRGGKGPGPGAGKKG